MTEKQSRKLNLRLARRGERVPDLDADPMGRRTLVLGTDGVHILFGQEAGMTCLWWAGRLRCFVSGD